MVLDLRLTKIGCRDDNLFFLYMPQILKTAYNANPKKNKTVTR